MVNRSDVKICEYCGAYLDVGEACDCIKTTAKLTPKCSIKTYDNEKKGTQCAETRDTATKNRVL